MSSSVRTKGSFAALQKELRTMRVTVTVGVHGSAGAHVTQRKEKRRNLAKRTPRKVSRLRRLVKRLVSRVARTFRGRPAGKAKVPEKRGKGSRAISLGELAAIHEYGIGVPMRSFIGTWARDPAHMALLRRVAGAMIARRIRRAQAQRLLGEVLQASCQANIANGIPPANAPSKRKGSSKPLIDTGQLRSAIAWKGAT